MLEDLNVHARILEDLREAKNLAQRTESLPGVDRYFYQKTVGILSELIVLMQGKPLPKISGERTVSIARRLGISSQMVVDRINRHRAKGQKIKEFWRDERGLVFPPGIFKGETIKHRRKKLRRIQRAGASLPGGGGKPPPPSKRSKRSAGKRR